MNSQSTIPGESLSNWNEFHEARIASYRQSIRQLSLWLFATQPREVRRDLGNDQPDKQYPEGYRRVMLERGVDMLAEYRAKTNKPLSEAQILSDTAFCLMVERVFDQEPKSQTQMKLEVPNEVQELVSQRKITRDEWKEYLNPYFEAPSFPDQAEQPQNSA